LIVKLENTRLIFVAHSHLLTCNLTFFSLGFEIFFGLKSAKNKLFQKIDEGMGDDFL